MRGVPRLRVPSKRVIYRAYNGYIGFRALPKLGVSFGGPNKSDEAIWRSIRPRGHIGGLGLRVTGQMFRKVPMSR